MRISYSEIPGQNDENWKSELLVPSRDNILPKISHHAVQMLPFKPTWLRSQTEVGDYECFCTNMALSLFDWRRLTVAHGHDVMCFTESMLNQFENVFPDEPAGATVYLNMSGHYNLLNDPYFAETRLFSVARKVHGVDELIQLTFQRSSLGQYHYLTDTDGISKLTISKARPSNTPLR